MHRLRFALLVAVVAVTAHDATYLVGHGIDGYGDALGASGHDGHWLPMAIGVAAILLGAALVAAARWWWLQAQLGSFGRDATQDRMGPITPGVLRLAARLFVAALVVFVIQENIEAIAIGGVAPGPSILLAPAYAAAIPALAATAVLFAVMSELIGARIVHLEQALAIARRGLPRPSAVPQRRPSNALPAPRSARSSQPDLGRAPPASVHA